MEKKLLLLTLAFVCAVVQGAWAQTEVGTEETLTAAVEWGGVNGYGAKSVKLTEDITLNSLLDIVNGNNVTLDLNGHKLSRLLSSAADDGNVIHVESGGQLTVRDGSGNDSGKLRAARSFGEALEPLPTTATASSITAR